MRQSRGEGRGWKLSHVLTPWIWFPRSCSWAMPLWWVGGNLYLFLLQGTREDRLKSAKKYLGNIQREIWQMHHFNGGRGSRLGQTVTILVKQWCNWPEEETRKPLNESTKLHFTGVSSNEAGIYLFSRLQRTTASRDPLREQALSSVCATQEQMFFCFFLPPKLLTLYSKGSFPLSHQNYLECFLKCRSMDFTLLTFRV